MTDMMSFVDFIVLALGAYMIYSAFSLRKGGDLSSNLIWDKKTPFSECRDKEGFRAYVFPRLLVSGIVIAADGALGVITARLGVSRQAYPILMGLTIAVIVYYAIFMKKAQNRFF